MQKHTVGYFRDHKIWHETVPRHTGLKGLMPLSGISRDLAKIFQPHNVQGRKIKVSTPKRTGFTRKCTLLLEYTPTFSIHHCRIPISQSAQVLWDSGILHKVTLPHRLSLQYNSVFLTMFGWIFLAYEKVSLHSMKDRRIF